MDIANNTGAVQSLPLSARDTVNNTATVQSPSLSTRGHRQQHSHCAESISVYTWTPSTTQPLCRVHLCLHVDTVNNTAIVQSPSLSTRGHRQQHSRCAESISVYTWTPSTTQPLCRVHLCLHVDTVDNTATVQSPLLSARDTVNNTATVQSPLLSTRGHRRQHSHCAESTSVCA